MSSQYLRVFKILFLITGTVLIVAIWGLSIAPRFKKIEHREAAYARPVETVLPVSMGKLAAQIRSKQFLQGTPYEDFQVFSATDPVFPDAFQLGAFAASDPELKGYANLPDPARKNDFYLATFLDTYWPSTYFYNGAPAKFSCKFILHLESAGGQTKIQVFEYQPEIWVGREFVLLGHHGPDFYYDIRFVEPTAQDRIKLLDRITSASNL